MTPSFPLSDWMQSRQSRIEHCLDKALSLSSESRASPQLLDAMRYSTLNGGKRLRALLVYATGEALQVELNVLDYAAMAVEFIHAYSLVHDDMPIMDDDDLRRGKPTCHKVFGEATALLTGDALQTLAFETLSYTPLQADNIIAMIRTLALSSGVQGMASGQAIDLASVGSHLNLDQLQNMHELKTAALIQASVLLAAHCADQAPDPMLKPLSEYALCMGLAFQVQDDVLDVIADTDTLGKQQGADIALDKPTYPALIGLEAAQQKAQDLIDRALSILTSLPYDTAALVALSHFVVQRQH